MTGTEDHQLPLNPGTIVSVVADQTRIGSIVEELDPVGSKRRFRVFHSGSNYQDYFEDQIQVAKSATIDDSLIGLSNHAFTESNEFRVRMTAIRLSNPQTDSIYSLMAARVKFIPFQFKPLLRLLRSDRPRLLIADDVGVGKTIEAGLILKELSTRQDLRRVLVLCPKALTTKWRAEMRRFDEDFKILNSDRLRYCLEETHEGGEWPEEYSRSIVNYELFRLVQFLDGSEGSRRHGLLELDPAPRFDLVIADEAHHLRTPSTGSHKLIEYLCSTTEAVLFLTATPVQISSDNLFVLLNLLRPELFADRTTFLDVVEPNKFITSAVRALRSSQTFDLEVQAEALNELLKAGETPWGKRLLRSDQRYKNEVSRLTNGRMDDSSRVQAIRELEELHSLAHIMNRTRRRDIGRFTIREPHTVSVPFTDEQRKVYDAVLEFRRQILLLEHDPRVVRLILDTVERQAASCIHALSSTVERMIASNGVFIEELTDGAGDTDNLEELPKVVIDAAMELLHSSRALSDFDPKFDQLQRILAETMADRDSPGKMLVFSFFLNTISYLQLQLSSRGLRVGVITGRIPDFERESLRDRFRLDRSEEMAIDVLLSSEVGCEGLDYEFCDRLINYDIPWNPMRIEQRIGRIDRFGQTSPKVMIFNFITPGTVEERVFFRCFERLGVFRDSVGDLEEVLGEVSSSLNRIVLSPDLSPEQMELLAIQTSDNAVRLFEEQRRLDLSSGGLLGLDDSFISEVDDVVSRGRFISKTEIQSLLLAFLKVEGEGNFLEETSDAGIWRLQLTSETRQQISSRLRSRYPSRFASRNFLRDLDAPRGVLATFDQEVASSRRDIHFLTPVHPLVRLASDYWASVDTPLIGGFRIATDAVANGTYVFASEIWETIAARSEVELVNFVVALPTLAYSEILSREFLNLLPNVTSSSSLANEFDEHVIANAVSTIEALSDERRRQSLRDLQESNEQLVNQKIASLDTYYGHRRDRAKTEVELSRDARITRMKASELARLESEHSTRRSLLDSLRTVEILSKRVAIGFMEITDGE